MRIHWLVFAPACAALSIALNAVPLAAAANPTVLPDCAGKPVAKPKSVVLACADAGVTAGSVTWTGWGTAKARGAGIASVNDCDPNCAAGHLRQYKIALVAAGTERCPSGQTAYARVTYSWIGNTPYPKTSQLVLFPCGSR
jgi:hypothetical protein